MSSGRRVVVFVLLISVYFIVMALSISNGFRQSIIIDTLYIMYEYSQGWTSYRFFLTRRV